MASFLAQIDGQGSLRSTEETAAKSKAETAKGGVNLGLLSLGAEGTTEWQKDVRRSFDPLWVNSRRLIEHFRSLPRGDSLQVGTVRILKGRLIAYDLSSLSNMMKSPAMESLIASGISDKNLEGRSSKIRNESKNKEAAIIRELLQGLGLGIGFALVTDAVSFGRSLTAHGLSPLVVFREITT